MSNKRKSQSKSKVFREFRPKITLLIITILFLAFISYFFRIRIIKLFGWGSISIYFYFLISFWYLLYQREGLAKHWRYWLFGCFVTLSSIGFLGLFNAPLEPSDPFITNKQNFLLSSKDLGDTLGGTLGDLISREPKQWVFYENPVILIILGLTRNLILLILGFSICWPNKMLLSVKQLLISSKQIYIFIKKFYLLISNFIESHRENKPIPETQEVKEKEIPQNKSENDANSVAENLLTNENSKPFKSETNHSFITDPKKWILPNLEMLNKTDLSPLSTDEIDKTKELIVSTLKEHGVEVTVGQVKPGPTVTMYGLEPGYGKKPKAKTSNKETTENEQPSRTRVRVDTILSREKDLALALASPNLRFQAPVPGTSLVGIEVPNNNPSLVSLRTTMETAFFKKFNKTNPLPLSLGIGSNGDPIYCDLTRMPHFLIAGATGSGKSVCLNSMICGLLLVRDPSELRMIMIDPKRIELTPYTGIPHLYTDPIVESSKAVSILKLVIDQMMDRFKTLESLDCKNIATFNQKSPDKLPYLVIIVDELADLMFSAVGEVEKSLVRIAQLGRATGIHLIVATQRPSVDVVTGLIKANFPSRISFSVTSQVDSRTVLDSPGAEKLLGRGDMLFLPVDQPKSIRVQGGLLTEPEINSIISHWKNQSSSELPQLNPETQEKSSPLEYSDKTDSLFQQAMDLAVSQKKMSTSLLQRRLRIGYPRAARLMDDLEEAGVVGPGDSGKPRNVLKH